MIEQGRAKYPVREVVLHTAAVPTGWHKGKSDQDVLEAFWNWHVKGRGWRKIGYHRIFLPDGRILYDTDYLRSLWEIGAHVAERNRGTLGFCMLNVKTHSGIGRFEDYFTDAQRFSVTGLIAEINRDYGGIERVTGHNDYTNGKECPGFKVNSGDWL
ncbi:N-acetylmuramoyl-L-alanine amidase [Pseudooceanicola nitratireducens]|uniref:N-acetylmuramoyl-L-alanine amidase n=1 Tax=Pseudooceanicola nitratireducens TaxID=517719 RepID=UPI003C7ABBC7